MDSINATMLRLERMDAERALLREKASQSEPTIDK